MKHRVFLIAGSLIFTCLFSTFSRAETAIQYETAERIRSEVHAFMILELQDRLSAVKAEDEVEITISNLDNRLRLPFCQTGMRHKLASSGTRGNHMTVRVRCEDNKPWSIFVPAKIDIISDMVVASRGVSRGTVISEQDLHVTRTKTSNIGHAYFDSVEQVVGMEARRTLRSGMPIRQSAVKAATVVRKGDKVVLEAGNRSFSVVAPGQAMADGHIGKQIRVKNTETQRIVDARIVAPGKVQVAF